MEKVNLIKPVLQVDYPTLSDRVQSSFIDGILIIFLMFITSSVLERYENAPDWIRIALFFGIWGIYEPVCTSLGFTVGNYMKGIRVRKISDTHQRINFMQALLRYMFKAGLGWISFLTMHFNPQRRAIHDFVAGSIMIRK
jgi:uncharacterized RDD family membrane protein YckC